MTTSAEVGFAVIAGVFTVLATITVVVRLRTTQLHRVYDVDGFVILSALVACWAYLVCVIINVSSGKAGDAQSEYSLAEFFTFEKVVLAGLIFTFVSTSLSKTSILLVYRRIFPTKAVRIATSVLPIIVGCWFVTAVIGTVATMVPKFHILDQTIGNVGRQPQTFVSVMVALNALLDVVILFVPQYPVYQLQMAAKQKLQVSLIFLLGGLICVFSIIRAVMTATVNLSDWTASEIKDDYWSMLEMNLSVICACVPTIAGLIRGRRRRSSPSPAALAAQVNADARPSPRRRRMPDPLSSLVDEADAQRWRDSVLERPGRAVLREKSWAGSVVGRVRRLGIHSCVSVEHSPTVARGLASPKETAERDHAYRPVERGVASNEEGDNGLLPKQGSPMLEHIASQDSQMAP